MKLPLLLSTFALICISGCALFGSGEVSLKRAEDYRIVAPKGWRKIQKKESDSAFKLSSGSIATVTSSCKTSTEADLPILTRQLLIGTRNIKFESQKKVAVGNSEGLHSKVDATIGKAPFQLEVFVIRKKGCVFDFSLINPKKLSDSDRKEFQLFYSSLRYGES